MKRFEISAIVCIFVLLSACKKSIPPPDKYLQLDKTTSSLKGGTGAADTIYITSNDEWMVTMDTNVDWLQVSPSQGTGDAMIILTSASSNTGSNRRTTNIEVSSVRGSDQILVTVVQFQLNETIAGAIFGGEGNDRFNDIVTTPDGGYIAVGASSSTEGDGAGSQGGEDVWVVKFNDQGAKVWHKKFGGTNDDGAHAIIRTSSNNYIILGSTLSTDGDITNNKGSRDAWLLGIDGDGNLQWEKTLGGSADETLHSLYPGGNGTYLLAGWTSSNDGDVSGNAGGADAWIVNVDHEGHINWQETYGGTGEDMAYDVTPVSDGGYIFCGSVSSNDGDVADRTASLSSVWIVKLNTSRGIGGKVYLGESRFEYGAIILEASNGDYVVAGQTNTPGEFDHFHADRDVFICRLDATGNIRWKKAYGGSMRDEPGDLIEAGNGDFVFGGSTLSSDGDAAGNNGAEDAWLMRINGDGEVSNSYVSGGEADDRITKVKKLNNTHFVFVGHSGSYADAYPNLPDLMHGWFQVTTLP